MIGRLIFIASSIGILIAKQAVAINPPCSHAAFARDIRSMVHNARVFGPVDKRMELPTAADKFKFSKSEVNQLRKMVGAIYCPPSPGFPKGGLGTAYVIGKSNEIFTAGHVTTNEEGKHRDLKTCLFTNFENPRVSIPIDANNQRTRLPEWAPRTGDDRYDRARLVLTKPIKGAEPLQPERNGKKLMPGDEIFLLSSQNRDFKSSDREPIVSPCSVRDVAYPGDGLSRVKTDCDSNKGSSGGPMITRENGRLTVRAMLVTETDTGAPENSDYDGMLNYVQGIGIDDEFLSWVAPAKK